MRIFIAAVTVLACIYSCHHRSAENPASPSDTSRYIPKKYVEVQHPDWSRNATLYEVNLRQFTKEGTFKAFEKHLPRLKALGVDIIWLMPIHPIGEKNRKGSLGSYYSVNDYYGINPEFGTMQDFKDLVQKIHGMNMHVIIDWVANHSAWDNMLATQHPDWYTKSLNGSFQSTPWRDYDDIIDFDYSKPGLREYMTNALKFWVKETGIDGYRCDVASFVPIDFWENARKELDAIKPVFLLAEAADRDLHKTAFDATYAWSLWDNLHAIATTNKPVNALTEGYIAEHVSIWPPDAYRLNFVDNHDKNAWEGTTHSNFGKALEAAVVLTVTMEGMPLIYSGQEAGLNRSLKFFEKDPIEWKDDTIGKLYQKLFQLKHQQQALWNGASGGEMLRIKNDKMQQLICFVRNKNNSRVITMVNYSAQPVTATLDATTYEGIYRNWVTNQSYTLQSSQQITLQPWSYLVLVK